MKALLIIDMQKVLFTPQTPRFDAENVIARINHLSAAFRSNGLPVIFIQHDGSRDKFCYPGSREWEILEELVRHSGDEVISKKANDAFYQTRLHQFLQMNRISELVITGCATDFCVDTTVKSALAHNYNVTVIADAHTTADRPHLQAAKIIEHYNWVWSELIPTEGKVNVVSSDRFML